MISFPKAIEKYIHDKPFTQDRTGMSGSDVLVYDDMVLKFGPATKNELETVEIMKWLSGKIPVPKVIEHIVQHDTSFLLMSKIKGKMGCDNYFLEHSDELVSLLADVFKKMWSIDINDCPRERSIDTELKEARSRVENGLVNIELCEPETFGENGFKDPQQLLEWLENNRPSYEAVFSHGDLCLPNILFDNGELSGLIDLGDSGIGDKWRDIALCYRSLKHNFNGTYGNKVYQDFDPDILFIKLGIEPDYDKLKYYILLDELF